MANLPAKKNSTSKAPLGELEELVISYQRVLELADRVASTLLIRNNDWLVQVKAIRQHYLFNNEEALLEMKTMAQAALEISSRQGEKVTLLYMISFRSGEGYILSDQKKSSKDVVLGMDEGELIPKLMGLLK